MICNSIVWTLKICIAVLGEHKITMTLCLCKTMYHMHTRAKKSSGVWPRLTLTCTYVSIRRGNK